MQHQARIIIKVILIEFVHVLDVAVFAYDEFLNVSKMFRRLGGLKASVKTWDDTIQGREINLPVVIHWAGCMMVIGRTGKSRWNFPSFEAK